MAYLVSQQRRRLEQQIETIKAKVGQADNGPVPADLRDYAIAAAIFLAHAEVENYFVDVLEDVARVYSQAARNAVKLPSKFRAHLIAEKFGLDSLALKIVARTGEQEVFQKIEKWFVSPNIPLLTGAGFLAPVNGKDIYGDYSYPSLKNIERVLRRLGVGDPKGALNREGGRDVVGLLESVADLRTALAHAATLPGVSVQDVIQRIEGLKLFVEAFDKVLYAQVRTTLAHQSWRRLMC